MISAVNILNIQTSFDSKFSKLITLSRPVFILLCNIFFGEDCGFCAFMKFHWVNNVSSYPIIDTCISYLPFLPSYPELNRNRAVKQPVQCFYVLTLYFSSHLAGLFFPIVKRDEESEVFSPLLLPGLILCSVSRGEQDNEITACIFHWQDESTTDTVQIYIYI